MWSHCEVFQICHVMTLWFLRFGALVDYVAAARCCVNIVSPQPVFCVLIGRRRRTILCGFIASVCVSYRRRCINFVFFIIVLGLTLDSVFSVSGVLGQVGLLTAAAGTLPDHPSLRTLESDLPRSRKFGSHAHALSAATVLSARTRFPSAISPAAVLRRDALSIPADVSGRSR